MQTKCPKCSTTVRTDGAHWEINGGPCIELSGTKWSNRAEFCPTLSLVAEPDVVLPGASDRVVVEEQVGAFDEHTSREISKNTTRATRESAKQGLPRP